MKRDQDGDERDWPAVAAALRAVVPPAAEPGDLAARAWRGAVSPRPAPGLVDLFARVGARAALAGAVAAALVWGGLWMRGGGGAGGGGGGGARPALVAADPADLEVALWTGEGPDGR
jgi:hypothetical protein